MEKEMRLNKLMQFATIGTILGCFLQLIAVGTDWWAVLDIPGGVFRMRTNSFILQRRAGLWKICDSEVDNKTLPVVYRDYCDMLPLFPTQKEIDENPEFDNEIIIISLALMFVAHVFAYYAMRGNKNMYKNITAILHFMAVLCIIICNEVFVYSFEYEKEHLPKRYPLNAKLDYGWSYYLSWFPLGLCVIAVAVFFYCARKSKQKDHNIETGGNDGVILGR